MRDDNRLKENESRTDKTKLTSKDVNANKRGEEVRVSKSHILHMNEVLVRKKFYS